jgi:hypothetical protein
MRHGDDPILTAPTSTTTPTTAFEPISARRTSHVLLVDRKQRLLLRRTSAPGLPHGGQLTSSVVANVEAGESYEAAAERAMRALLGRRSPELRYVDRTWIDRDGGRTFLDVFVALYDGDVPETHVALPIADVIRAARLDDRRLEGAFLRALRAVHGESAMW